MDAVTPLETAAWHWTGDLLRDGRAIPPVGEWLVHEGPIMICHAGFHASEILLDSLKFAPAWDARAASAAAWAAALSKYNDWLTDMVETAHAEATK